MDTKKFVLIVFALTAVVCALTVVYNFASMPAYGDTVVSAVPLYAAQSGNASGTVSAVASSAAAPASAVSSKAAHASAVSSAASSASVSVTSSKATASHKTASAKMATAQAPVNLNTATAAQLEAVPYIGAKKAQAIVDYRAAHGPFSSVDELDNVKGFGKKTIAKIRPFLTTA